MRHQKRGRKLGRLASHRRALWSNMVSSLIEHERVETTDAKAKELRRMAERAIGWSTSLGDLLTRDQEKLDAVDRARVVHAMRMARRVVRRPGALAKLFDEVGPRFLGRLGGYTRVIKLRHRRGDASPISIVELLDRPKVEPPAPKKGKGGGESPEAEASAAKKPQAASKAKSKPKKPSGKQQPEQG